MGSAATSWRDKDVIFQLIGYTFPVVSNKRCALGVWTLAFWS